MAKIVLANLQHLDFISTVTQTKVIESADELSANENVVFVLPVKKENLSVAKSSEHDIYIPPTLLVDEYENKPHVHVYFDLENFSFFPKAKEVIEKAAHSKSVLRYRRMVKQNDKSSILAWDLYVLSNLFGDVVDMKIKQTDQKIVPAHTILLINFSCGTMAHLEYTVSDRERIEFEWSGIKNIIEFDSNEMCRIQPGDQTKSPILYTVDSILGSAHKIDSKLMKQLSKLEELMSGGGES